MRDLPRNFAVYRGRDTLFTLLGVAGLFGLLYLFQKTETEYTIHVLTLAGLFVTLAVSYNLINGVAAPPSEKNIIDVANDYFRMSLLNTTIHPTTKSAYDLEPEIDGAPRPNPDGSTNPGTATLTIYAVEDDLPSTLVAVDTFVLLSIEDASDGGVGG